jgi:hypothetical protein
MRELGKEDRFEAVGEAAALIADLFLRAEVLVDACRWLCVESLYMGMPMFLRMALSLSEEFVVSSITFISSKLRYYVIMSISGIKGNR